MVTITAPKSVYVDNNDSSTYTLKWTNAYTGQYAFEVLYRLKTSSSWLTTGKVTSTSSSYDLRNLHSLTGVDIDEVQYRLVVYYKTTAGIETKDFSDAAYIYSLVFNSGTSGYLNAWDGSQKVQMPLMDTINNDNIEKLNINVSGNIKKIPLVADNTPLAGSAKIKTANGVKHLAVKDPTFTYDTSKMTTYGNVYGSYAVPQYGYKYYTYSYVGGTGYQVVTNAYNTYAYKYYYTRYYTTTYAIRTYGYNTYANTQGSGNKYDRTYRYISATSYAYYVPTYLTTYITGHRGTKVTGPLYTRGYGYGGTVYYYAGSAGLRSYGYSVSGYYYVPSGYYCITYNNAQYSYYYSPTSYYRTLYYYRNYTTTIGYRVYANYNSITAYGPRLYYYWYYYSDALSSYRSAYYVTPVSTSYRIDTYAYSYYRYTYYYYYNKVSGYVQPTYSISYRLYNKPVSYSYYASTVPATYRTYNTYAYRYLNYAYLGSYSYITYTYKYTVS